MYRRPSAFFREYSNDKVDRMRNYPFFYDMAITTLLALNDGDPINVFELGCSKPMGSGNIFSEMGQVSRYVGVDINPLVDEFGRKGRFIRGDAYLNETVKKVSAYAPFHLLIDDACHTRENQVKFFDKYIRLSDTPSIMVCEDVRSDDIFYIIESLSDLGIWDRNFYVIECHGLETKPVRLNNLVVRCNLGDWEAKWT